MLGPRSEIAEKISRSSGIKHKVEFSSTKITFSSKSEKLELKMGLVEVNKELTWYTRWEPIYHDH